MRTVVLLGLIALGFSLPALLSNPQSSLPAGPWQPGQNPPTGDLQSYIPAPVVVSPSPADSGSARSPFHLASSSAGGPAATQPQPPVYNAFTHPGEYLNFEITPDWVRNRWPRVSITPGEDQLTGLRVALVSGPRPVDIHGSLTYYFDKSQQLQRIAFRGWTGDSSELVRYLGNRLQLSPRDSQAAEYYEVTSWGKLKGFLRLDYPPVVRREATTEQLMILMEMVNPSSSLTISIQNSGILEAMDAGNSR